MKKLIESLNLFYSNVFIYLYKIWYKVTLKEQRRNVRLKSLGLKDPVVWQTEKEPDPFIWKAEDDS